MTRYGTPREAEFQVREKPPEGWKRERAILVLLDVAGYSGQLAERVDAALIGQGLHREFPSVNR